MRVRDIMLVNDLDDVHSVGVHTVLLIPPSSVVAALREPTRAGPAAAVALAAAPPPAPAPSLARGRRPARAAALAQAREAVSTSGRSAIQARGTERASQALSRGSPAYGSIQGSGTREGITERSQKGYVRQVRLREFHGKQAATLSGRLGAPRVCALCIPPSSLAFPLPSWHRPHGSSMSPC